MYASCTHPPLGPQTVTAPASNCTVTAEPAPTRRHCDLGPGADTQLRTGMVVAAPGDRWGRWGELTQISYLTLMDEASSQVIDFQFSSEVSRRKSGLRVELNCWKSSVEYSVEIPII